MKETLIEELFTELWDRARNYSMLNAEQKESFLYRRKQIIKEITTKIEENVLREVMKLSENQEAEDGFGNYYPVITQGDIKSLAESKNIKL